MLCMRLKLFDYILISTVQLENQARSYLKNSALLLSDKLALPRFRKSIKGSGVFAGLYICMNEL